MDDLSAILASIFSSGTFNEMLRRATPVALAAIDEGEYRSILLDLLKSKKKSTKGKDERDLFNKLLRFAAGRGFESRITLDCLSQLFKGTDCEDYADDME